MGELTSYHAERYGKWAGRPEGNKADPDRCAEEVAAHACLFQQCSRKRGHGPEGAFCKQHAKARGESNE